MTSENRGKSMPNVRNAFSTFTAPKLEDVYLSVSVENKIGGSFNGVKEVKVKANTLIKDLMQIVSTIMPDLPPQTLYICNSHMIEDTDGDLFLSDFIERDASFKITLQAVDRLPSTDTETIEDHRRLLIVGDVFKKHNSKMTHDRFVCCSIDLTKIIWSKSRADYFKGKFKGEMLVDDVLQVLKGWRTNEFKRLSLFSTSAKKQQAESCCFSLVTGSRSLDLETEDSVRCLEFFRGFKWLINYNAQIKLEAEQTLMHMRSDSKSDSDIDDLSVNSNNNARASSPAITNQIDDKSSVSQRSVSENFRTSPIHFSVFKKMSRPFGSNADLDAPVSLTKSSNSKSEPVILMQSKIETIVVTPPTPVENITSRVSSIRKEAIPNLIDSATIVSVSSNNTESKETKEIKKEIITESNLSISEDSFVIPKEEPTSLVGSRKSNAWKGNSSKPNIHKKQVEALTHNLNRLNDEMKGALQLINPEDDDMIRTRTPSTLINMSEHLPAAAFLALEKTAKKLIETAFASAAADYEANTGLNRQESNIVTTPVRDMKELDVFRCLINEIRDRRAEDTRAIELSEALQQKEAELKALRHYISEGSGVCVICSHKVIIGTTNERYASIKNLTMEGEENTVRPKSPKVEVAPVIEEISTDPPGSTIRNYSLDSNKAILHPILLKLNYGSHSWVGLTYDEVKVEGETGRPKGLENKQKMRISVASFGSGHLDECTSIFKSDNIIYAVVSAILDGRRSGVFLTWIGPKISGMQRAKVAFHEQKIIDAVQDDISVPIKLKLTCFEEITSAAIERSIAFNCRKLGISTAYVSVGQVGEIST